jgi:hypothetical protein
MSQAERLSCEYSIILKLPIMRKITALLIKSVDKVLPTQHLGLSSSTGKKWVSKNTG